MTLFVSFLILKGVLIGFFVSLAFGLWLLIGSLIYPHPIELLPLSTEGCPVEAIPTQWNTTTAIPVPLTSTGGVITTEAPDEWFVHFQTNSKHLLRDRLKKQPTSTLWNFMTIFEISMRNAIK